MKRFFPILALLAFLVIPAASHAQATKPANCATAAGHPCTLSTWTGPSCAATVTTDPTTGKQTAGPCIAALLRCTGTAATCPTSTLPTISTTAGASIASNSSWTVLEQTLAQTTAAGAWYDVNTLAYNSTYTYVIVLEFSGAGGGLWSGYSGTFPVSFGAAPAAPLGTPAAATSPAVTTVN